ncbi:MAG: hypothetical protein IID44_00300 [Planctomycetes bacterium]|nr:hypothetical protein [Planctomycetota bacterium]
MDEQQALKTAEQLAKHREFLDEIREKRLALKHKLENLTTVEKYHADEVLRLEGPLATVNLAPEVQTETSDHAAQNGFSISESATKHEACRLALRAMGRRSKTPEIADWLVAHGYGRNLRTKILRNACFTAMARKEEIFDKIDGKWGLIEAE